MHSRRGQARQQPLGIFDAPPLIQMERPVLLRARDVPSTEADQGPGVSDEPLLIVRRRCALDDEAIGRFDCLVPASDGVGPIHRVPAHEASGVPVAEALCDLLAFGVDLKGARKVTLPDREDCEIVQRHRRDRRVGRQGDLERLFEVRAAGRELDVELRGADGGERVRAELVELERLCDLQRILCHGDRLPVVSREHPRASGQCENARFGRPMDRGLRRVMLRARSVVRWRRDRLGTRRRVPERLQPPTPAPRQRRRAARRALPRVLLCRRSSPAMWSDRARRNRRSGRSGSPSGQRASASA